MWYSRRYEKRLEASLGGERGWRGLLQSSLYYSTSMRYSSMLCDLEYSMIDDPLWMMRVYVSAALNVCMPGIGDFLWIRFDGVGLFPEEVVLLVGFVDSADSSVEP